MFLWFKNFNVGLWDNIILQFNVFVNKVDYLLSKSWFYKVIFA